MSTITVLDSTNTPQVLQAPNPNGRAAAAASRPMALSNEDLAVLTGSATSLTAIQTALAGPIDTVIKKTSAAWSAIIGFSGAAITTTSGSPTITLNTPASLGSLMVGHQVVAPGIPVGTTIVALASGTANTSNAIYTLSANATATGSSVAASSVGPQLMIPANPLRRGYMVQNQSPTGNCYINNVVTMTPDFNSLLVGPLGFFQHPDNYSGTGTIYMMGTVAAQPTHVREW